jgi:hypothetical protein
MNSEEKSVATSPDSQLPPVQSNHPLTHDAFGSLTSHWHPAVHQKHLLCRLEATTPFSKHTTQSVPFGAAPIRKVPRRGKPVEDDTINLPETAPSPTFSNG